MDYSELIEIFESISDWNNQAQLHQCLTSLCNSTGFHFLSYHLLPSYGVQKNTINLTLTWPKVNTTLLNAIVWKMNKEGQCRGGLNVTKVDNRSSSIKEFFKDNHIGDKETEFYTLSVFGQGGRKGVFLFGLKPSSSEPTTLMSPSSAFMQAFHLQIVSTVQERTVINHEITRREGQVLGLLIKGLTNREIADKLSLSKFTVMGYLKAISLKLDANNRVELALKAIALEIV